MKRSGGFGSASPERCAAFARPEASTVVPKVVVMKARLSTPERYHQFTTSPDQSPTYEITSCDPRATSPARANLRSPVPTAPPDRRRAVATARTHQHQSQELQGESATPWEALR